MSEAVLYFAYGSNMSTERMRSRLPFARVVGRARLPDRRLVCNKRSKDGSGKANLADSQGDVVWGVLYELDSAQLRSLDEAEAGYERTRLRVSTDAGDSIEAEVYISDDLTADHTPYDWYMDWILRGAREHQLPKAYVEYLHGLSARTDPRDT